jgi:hypothetical protein
MTMNASKNFWKGFVPVALSFLLLLADREAVAQFRLSGEVIGDAVCRTASSARYTLLDAVGQLQPIGTFSSRNMILEAGLIPCLPSPDEALSAEGLSLAKLSSETAGANMASGIPETFGLHQNFPNPFNPETSIRYQLPEAGEVTLRVYNMLGEEVAAILQGRMEAGYHQITWNGKDKQGKELASGIYLYRLEAQASSGKHFWQTRKMNLLR